MGFHPWLWVRVLAGTGTDGPEIPRGYPVPFPICTDHFCRGSQQQLITGFTQKTTKPPLVTKAGIHEHMLAIVATCDLVSAHYFLGLALLITGGQLFRFIEQPAVRRLITYLNSKV
jgi:hypothetical protein